MMPRIFWSGGFARLDNFQEQGHPALMKNNSQPPKAPLTEFLRWRESCDDQSLEPEDYLGALVEATEFPDEGLVVLMALMWPRFVEHDGRVYFESRFSADDLQDIPEDHAERPDFWLNLSLISTWIRDGGKAEWAARVISESWRARLSQSFPEYTFAIETLVDGEDTALTFYRHMG